MTHRTGLRAASVTMAVALVTTLAPLAAWADGDPTVPSEREVTEARQAVTGQAGQVAALDQQIADANAELMRVGRVAEQASSRYNHAAHLLRTKETEETRLATRAAAARRAAAGARADAGRQAARQYRSGGAAGTLEALFGPAGPQSLVDRAGGLSLASRISSREVRSSAEASATASALEAAARRATAQRKVAATNAATARTTAQTAYSTALAASTRLATQKEAAIHRLAALRKVSVETERRRQDGLEAQRLAAAARAQREAQARAAAEAQARRQESNRTATGANTQTGYPLPVTPASTTETTLPSAPVSTPVPEGTLATPGTATPTAAPSTSEEPAPVESAPATTPAPSSTFATPSTTDAPAPTTVEAPPAPATSDTPPAPTTVDTPPPAPTTVDTPPPAPTTVYTPPPAPSPTYTPPPPATPTGTGYNAAASSAAIAYAKARLGYPYLWGATGPTYYDCSGLVAMAWRSAGVYMPNWNEGIYAMDFAHVPLAQAMPGDILLFGSGPDDIWHSAIYLGGGMMINATHPGSGISIYPVDWGGVPMAYVVRPAT